MLSYQLAFLSISLCHSQDLKRLVGYDKKVFSILSTQPKKAEEYLDSLIQDARKFSESQQDGSTENTCKGISISGVMKILEKNPNLVGKCKQRNRVAVCETLRLADWSSFSFTFFNNRQGIGRRTSEKRLTCRDERPLVLLPDE